MEMDEVPEACTLPTADRPVRLAKFDDLFAVVERGDRPTAQHLRLTIAGGADREAGVRDLARRETDCCGFFRFTVTREAAERIRLDVEVPPQYAHVLDALEKRTHAQR